MSCVCIISFAALLVCARAYEGSSPLHQEIPLKKLAASEGATTTLRSLVNENTPPKTGQLSVHQHLIPASYVIPGGEGSGPWGEWGEVTPCSRTCGGGVASQKRICLQPEDQSQCKGGDTKYFSCQTQDCPDGSGDFRAEQCAEFKDKLYRGFKYNWVPYTTAPNPCELNCMPHGERFYFRHKLQVTDGTKCNDESFDVCVNGRCQPVGCDMMLNSSAREDKCRECRGNGDNCRTTEGIFDSQDLVKGYNDILLIPAGSTTINIEEVAPSNNYLVLRAKNGTYYLNGHYHIDFPRTITIAGALWTYERSQQGYAAPDKLRCLGPTTEPLYLSLLLQDENVGIQYEYSVPKTSAPPTDKRYNWVHEQFTPCSATCGGGFQTRNVTCTSREELEIVEDSLCDERLKPPTNQSCNTNSCLVQWVEGLQRCGSGGVRSREVTCLKIVSNGAKSTELDKECFDLLGPKPEVFQKCNEDAPCPKWLVGRWRPCDKLCGEGKQTRLVVCYQENKSHPIELLDDKNCTEKKPEEEQPCMMQPCDVEWVTSSWSGCSVNCGEGVQTRKVYCGVYYDDVSGGGVKMVEEVQCSNLTRYNDTKPCTVPNEECLSQWFAGSWSECSEKGEQFRRVMCLRGDKKAADCDGTTMLNSVQPCNPRTYGPEHVRIPAGISGAENAWVIGELYHPFQLCCSPCGYPPPSVEWYRTNKGNTLLHNDTEYEPRGDVLHIRNLTMKNLGTYTCGANNGVGQPASWKVVVRAYEPEGLFTSHELLVPRGTVAPSLGTQCPTMAETTTTTTLRTVKAPTEPERIPAGIAGAENAWVIGELHHPFQLCCSPRGYPPPAVEWYRSIKGNTLLHNDTEYEPRGDVLHIRNLTMKNLGTYTCGANNGVGQPASWKVVVRAYEPEGLFTSHELLVPRGTVAPSLGSQCPTMAETTTITTLRITKAPTVTSTGGELTVTTGNTTTNEGSTVSSVTSNEGKLTEAIENTTGASEVETSTLSTTNEGSTVSSEPVRIPAGIAGAENAWVIGELHHPFQLCCSPRGYPPPSVEWYRTNKGNTLLNNDTEYDQRGDVLLIRNLTMKNLGTYTCGANNGVGQPASWKVVVRAYEREGLFTSHALLVPRGTVAPSLGFKCLTTEETTTASSTTTLRTTEAPTVTSTGGELTATTENTTTNEGSTVSSVTLIGGELTATTGNRITNEGSTVSSDVCQLPMLQGPCDDSLMRWFYDPTTESCSQFTYGGCEGNDNRFESLEACENRCRIAPAPVAPTAPTTTVIADGPPECKVPDTLEECRYGGEVWFFDPSRHECVSHANQEAGPVCRHTGTFPSQEACERSCGAFRGVDVCKQRMDPGPCQSYVWKVYFDPFSGQCHEFAYGGCLGGANRFSSIEECSQVCKSEIADPCTLPAEGGNCISYVRQWYYDLLRDQCNQFVYSGCDGNENRFETQRDCEARCSTRPAATTTTTTTPPQHLAESDCKIPSSLAPCGNNVTVFYYDSEKRQCLVSGIGGCGHPNSYSTEEECERRCGAFRGIDVCGAHLDPGPCRASIQKIYWDALTGSCQEYAYGGCDGGPNRFSSVEECMNVCGDTGPARACLQEVHTGHSCAAAPAPRWHYSVAHADCVAFAYLGCGGNDNNFRSYSDCADACRPSGTRGDDVPAAPLALPLPEPEVEAHEGGSATLRCLFQSNPPPKITWTFGELTIDGSAGRYRLMSDGALEIVSLYRNDTGVYICVADNGLGVAKQEIHLVVKGPVRMPVGIAGDENATVTGELGSPLEVRCLAYGYPPPTVYWYRGYNGAMVPYNDAVFFARTNILLIRSLAIETLGQYTCQAYNGEGKAASWVVFVRAYQPEGLFIKNKFLVPRNTLLPRPRTQPPTTVESTTTTTTTTEAPRPLFTVPVSAHVSTPYLTLNRGADLRLTCEVDGFPEPDVHWTKDGATIQADGRITITGSIASRLMVARVSESDSGLYTCHASNRYTSQSDTAQINVQQIVVPDKCTDNPFFADCNLIVRSKFCRHSYYSKFCCKSCLEASQLDHRDVELQATL